MITEKKATDCCGCTACASICPRNAISMKPDPLGFLYPSVDESICIHCGMCERVCAFHDHYDQSLNLPHPLAFAARHKKAQEMAKSRSGGAFIAISDLILDEGGVVYGVGYTDHFRVVHKRARTKTERDEFRGSKYVQSDLTGVFRQVKKDLENGLTVLFSGTPCQTAGLGSYVGRKLREKLLLVDIVCHGVPSPHLWRDHVQWLENKYSGKCTAINFRDKSMYGWAAHRETYCFKGNRIVTSDEWTHFFYMHIMFRRSCETCRYTNTKRPSDITLADFWGWEKSDPKFNLDDKGCSLVLLNTAKGVTVWRNCQNDMNTIPIDRMEDCMQPSLQHVISVNPKMRQAFENAYIRHGFPYILKKYGRKSLWNTLIRIKRKIKRILSAQ